MKGGSTLYCVKKIVTGALIASMMMPLSGCVMTVDQMYCPPRRSEGFHNLQTVMDEAMQGMVFSAPISGDNQQPVQMIDLNGDSVEEAIVFAKGTKEKPLNIMVFSREGDEYRLSTSIESTGSAFDKVEYAQLDGEPGVEMIVGRQVQNQVLRSFSVYKYAKEETVKLLTANYQRYFACDMDGDGQRELITLSSGTTENDSGLITVYSMEGDQFVKSPEVPISRPMNHVSKVTTGALEDGSRAVFVSAETEQDGIVTDIFVQQDSELRNVVTDRHLDTFVRKLKKNPLYPEDIDRDGVTEIPELVRLRNAIPEKQELEEFTIRWYSMDSEGSKTEKLYTYHNFTEGWYMELDDATASRLSVLSEGNGQYSFYIWNENETQSEKLWTIYMLIGEERSAQAAENHRFVLIKTDTVVFAGELEDAARLRGVNEDHLKEVFHLIRPDWKSGEM